MMTQKMTDPDVTAFKMFSPSRTPAYFHHPRSKPKEVSVAIRMATSKGAAENKIVR